MKLLLVLALVALAAAKFEYTQEFQDWKVKYNKVYETKETELERQIIWESNKKFVENHNANSDMFGFTVAMNEFADLVSIINVFGMCLCILSLFVFITIILVGCWGIWSHFQWSTTSSFFLQ